MNELLSFTADQFRRDVRVQCAILGLDLKLPEIQHLLDAAEEHVARGSEHIIKLLAALDPKQFVRSAIDQSYLILEQASQTAILEPWSLIRSVVRDLDKRLARIDAGTLGIWLRDELSRPLVAIELNDELPNLHIGAAYEDKIIVILAALTGLAANDIRTQLAPHQNHPTVEIAIWRMHNAAWDIDFLRVSCEQFG